MLPDIVSVYISGEKAAPTLCGSLQRKVSALEVRPYKHLKELVTVDVADEASGVVVCGYVCRVLGEDIANDLVDGVVALLDKSVVDDVEVPAELSFLILVDCEGHGFIEHCDQPPDIGIFLACVMGRKGNRRHYVPGPYVYYNAKVDLLQVYADIFPDLTVI